MSFDRLARHCRWMEAVLAGELLQRCRTHWLPAAGDGQRVLLAGEGCGRMLEACAELLPGSSFTVLDESKAMLEQARHGWLRIGGQQSIVFQQANLLRWQPAGQPFDLISTNFFLDCFSADELPQVIANISQAASPTARWLLSDFILPASGWRRWRARLVLASAYGFFRFATGISASRITAPDAHLLANGFKSAKRARFNHDLLQADLWQRQG